MFITQRKLPTHAKMLPNFFFFFKNLQQTTKLLILHCQLLKYVYAHY